MIHSVKLRTILCKIACVRRASHIELYGDRRAQRASDPRFLQITAAQSQSSTRQVLPSTLYLDRFGAAAPHAPRERESLQPVSFLCSSYIYHHGLGSIVA